MQSILRYSNTHVTTPINVPKEAPLMVVMFTVRHCEEKCVAVCVLILMRDGFDQKSAILTTVSAWVKIMFWHW